MEVKLPPHVVAEEMAELARQNGYSIKRPLVLLYLTDEGCTVYEIEVKAPWDG